MKLQKTDLLFSAEANGNECGVMPKIIRSSYSLQLASKDYPMEWKRLYNLVVGVKRISLLRSIGENSYSLPQASENCHTEARGRNAYSLQLASAN